MKNQKPFFKNSFKNLIKNKIQLVTIIILVFLTSFVFTLTFSSTNRIQNSYNNFISEKNSNLHDFVIDLSNTSYKNDFEKDNFKSVSNTDVRDNLIISYIQDRLSNTAQNFDFDRVESRLFSLSSGKDLKVFALNPDQKVDKLVVSKGMSLELWKQYSQAVNNYTKRWVYVNEQFAEKNNIQINDIIRLEDDSYGTSILVEDSENVNVDLSIYDGLDINLWIDNTEYTNENWFQVVGYGSTADFSTPVLDSTKPLPNLENEGLVYVDPINFGFKYAYYDSVYPNNDFGFENSENRKIWYTDNELKTHESLKYSSESDREVSYVGKFENGNDIQNSTSIINEYLTNLEKAKEIELYASYVNTINDSNPLAIAIGDNSYTYNSRTSLLTMTIAIYQLFSLVVMLITLSIGVIMLVTMLTNQIKKSFGQTGVLRSLGYKQSSLIWSNTLYPLFISIIGGTVGYILGVALQEIVINLFNNFFSIKMESFDLSWESLLVNIFGIFIILEIITLITYFYVLNKFTPLEMIHYESRNETNKFKLGLKKILTTRKAFNSRFRGAILSSSVSKFVSVFFVMFISSTLITIGAVMPVVLDEYKNKTYLENEYDNKIEYQSPIYNSPTSFYKTYNPYSNINETQSLDSGKILNMYIDDQISSKIYNPSHDLSTLNDMTYKAIDIDFLKSNDLTLELPEGTTPAQENNFYKVVIFNLWSDLKNYNIDVFWNKEALLKILISPEKAKEYINELENLRLFYLKYRNTLGLDERREGYFIGSKKNIIATDGGPDNSLISNADLEKIGVKPSPITLTDSGSIKDDSFLERSLFDFVNTDEWNSRLLSIVPTVYNWTMAFFYNNLQQAFLQGMYSQSPTSVRQIIDEEYQKEDGYFNMSFGLIPYNSEKEDIGIFMNAVLDDQSFKIYGIEKENKTKNLVDEKGNDLKPELFKTDNSIIINQSLAKRLNLSVGDEIDVEHIIQALEYKNEIISTTQWKTDLISAEGKNGFTNASNIYSSSMFDNNKKGWTNSTINPTGNNLVYSSEIDLTSESMVGPTAMTDQVSRGNLTIQNTTKNHSYKIVGIADQYGENAAWINNSLAKDISNFSQTEELLFELFRKEWQNPYQPNEEVNILTNFLNNKNNDFNDFKEWTSLQENQKYWTLFENEYPLFNYKTSLDSSFTDISKGVSTTQNYGDYSMFGLNGGTVGNDAYTGYSNSSISNVIKVDEALKVTQRINQTINSIIYFIVFVAIFLSAIIILLVINFVITDNAKIIAVMKILGYKERYIASLFIGIYIPVVIFSALIGFGISWLILSISINAITPMIVLPLTFKLWYIIPGIFGSWLLYSISVVLSWTSLKKVSMLMVVQGG